MAQYYWSLFWEAFHRTVGIAKAEQLPFTLLLAVLGVIFYALWKRYWDKEPVKDFKALAFAAIAPVIVVFGGRLIYEGLSLVVERQNACLANRDAYRSSVTNLEKYRTHVGETVESIERGLPKLSRKIVDEASSLKNATEEREQAEKKLAVANAAYEAQRSDCAKMTGPSLFACQHGAWEGFNGPIAIPLMKRVDDAKTKENEARDGLLRSLDPLKTQLDSMR